MYDKAYKSTLVAYNLIPEEITKSIPLLYTTEDEEDPIAYVKLFTPDSSWTWYVTEYDSEKGFCFGLVIGHEREFGYFSLNELQSVRGPLGLPIERDLYWEPKPVSQITS